MRFDLDACARTASGSGFSSAVSTPRSLLQELGARAHDAFDEHAHAARRLRHLADDRHRADAVQIVERRLLGLVLLHQQQDEAIARERAVDRLDRQRTADAERRHRQRQHDRAAQRNDREFGREGWGLRRLSHAVRSAPPRELAIEQHHPAIIATRWRRDFRLIARGPSCRCTRAQLRSRADVASESMLT